jgi:hypothetical protein
MRSLTAEVKTLLRTAGEAGYGAFIDNAPTCERPATASRVTRAKTSNGATLIYCLPERVWREVYCIDNIYLAEPP